MNSNIILTLKKTFSVFPYSYRNTSGSLGKQEIEVGKLFYFHKIIRRGSVIKHSYFVI